MTAQEFASYLGELGKQLNQIGPQVAETKAIAGTSLMVERLQSQGVPGKSYSTQRLPGWYFSDKELNAGGRAYLSQKDGEKDKSKQGVTWGEFRAAQGLQNKYVDLTYSGRMLGGIIIVAQTSTGSTFTASTGGSDSEVDAKLGWNAERYGNAVFQPTAAENQELDQVVLDILESYISQITTQQSS